MRCPVPLSKGAVAYVSPEDFERVSRHTWTLDSTGYAVRKVTLASKRYRKVLLHRFILQAQAGMDVDHIDGDKLNNVRGNLRLASRSQNSANRGPSKGRYKGVYWRKDRNRWCAGICVNGKKIHIGHFTDEREAARAYNKVAREHFGEFAYLNLV